MFMPQVCLEPTALVLASRRSRVAKLPATHVCVLVAVLNVGYSMRLRAQESSPQHLHDAIAQMMASAGGSNLPAGDTMVSWTTDPVLYHTVASSHANVRSGMLRNDGLLGVEETHWASGALTEFTATWKTHDSDAVVTRGLVEGSVLHVSSPRDVKFAAPKMPWGVADYGMEEHLVPLFNALPTFGGTQEIAVFRPYGLKWDTVTVTVTVRPGVRVLQTIDGTARTVFVITSGGTLLWARRLDHSWERRPLEQTRLYREFLRVRDSTGVAQ
jgi:hypothetical protein